MEKFCSNCGTGNSEIATYCASCGKPLAVGQAVVGQPVRYAGFWLRVVASILDFCVLGVVAAALVFEPFSNIAIGWLYFALMESSEYQGTLGKKALSLKVTTLDGQRLSFGRATARHFSKIISSATLFVGFIMAAFTKKKQALHDLIAECVVVRG